MNQKIDFLKLYEQIYTILPSGSLQSLMDVCYEVTKTPILITDISYNVLGIAPDAPTGDDLWDYLLQHRGCEFDKIEPMLKDGIIRSVDTNKAPYVIDWGTQNGRPKIQGIVRINNVVEAYVTMNCCSSSVTEDKLKAMEIIQTVCAYFYKGKETEGNMSHTYQKLFMTELMNDKIKTANQLTHWFTDMSFQTKPPYIITAISAVEKNGQLVLSLIKKSLQALHLKQLMLIDQNILYCLHFEYETRLFNANTLNELLQRFDGRCGISMAFDDLLQFSRYRRQARRALKIGEALHSPERLYHYEDFMLPSLFIDQLSTLSEADYIPPVLFTIKRYDEKNSTEFFPTIRSYLLNLYNTSETASQLHIHRNTLLYRLGKAEALFGISLKDPELCFQLLTAFYMIDLKNKVSI